MPLKFKENELAARFCVCDNCGTIFRWDEAKWRSPTGLLEDSRITCPYCNSYLVKEVLLDKL